MLDCCCCLDAIALALALALTLSLAIALVVPLAVAVSLAIAIALTLAAAARCIMPQGCPHPCALVPPCSHPPLPLPLTKTVIAAVDNNRSC